MNVFAVDAGNTHLRIASIDCRSYKESTIIHVERDGFVSILRELIEQDESNTTILAVSTVVASIRAWLEESACEAGFVGTIVWCDHTKSELIQSKYSETLGIDRYVDAVAAVELYPGRDVIVIDSGTATTVDWITADRVFAGGVIIPGLGLKAKVITGGTDQLPPIDPYTISVVDCPVNTMDAIGSGLLLDCAGGIEKAVAYARQKVPNAVIVACGGGWELIRPYVDEEYCTVPDLTLKGTALLGVEAVQKKGDKR